ncbi:ATP/GTP-binding protein [Leifsonia shinshuensis]|uniref:Nicotinamide riboside kinase n=1 Tax=Leifsonia shinshuensis TaxID=150026 RepID=A0A853CWI3_9MICO|nr:ATP-binding protein [Leifsonia shinshuensis]NYJ24619.1 nicotinamide riboside kinase [Leifsonia shinshuensis]
MRIAVSGTYSSGKTTTSIALAHLTGLPRTHAKTMREILPIALPGRRLEDCTVPELFELGMIRYSERAVHESHLPDAFISDGSSLHEWVYGKVRTYVGIHPGREESLNADLTGEMRFFDQVIDSIGNVVKRHAKNAYDVFIHLPIEFDLVTDGHRPVSERFRSLSDELLLQSLTDLEIPHHIVGGTVAERLRSITKMLALPHFMPIDQAIDRAEAEIRSLNVADELAR